MPLFIGVRHLWYMGYNAEVSQDLGIGWLNDQYYDRELGFLRHWDEEHLTRENAG